MADEHSFMRILREQVVAQANLLVALTSHPTLVGAGRERAVMDMLRGQLPRRYEVLSGTILGQDDEGIWQRENRQLDVMVVDTFDYPTLLRNGDIAVVLPQAVRVVIEVKSNLAAPPDPDRAAESDSPTSATEKDASRKDHSSKQKNSETFLDAVKQVARNRFLFGEMAPVLTILLSHQAPTGNDTLRGWLDLVIKTRHKLQEKLGGLEKGSKVYLSVEREANLLEASLFPDFIIADKGALAQRVGAKYEFFIAGDGKKEAAPGLVTLVSYVVDHLDRQDPVLGLMRIDDKYKSLGNLRQEAHNLFSTVMRPPLKPDADNAALELAEPPAEPNKDDPTPELTGDSTKGRI